MKSKILPQPSNIRKTHMHTTSLVNMMPCALFASSAAVAFATTARADITYQFNNTFQTTVAGNYDDVLQLNATGSLANFNLTGITARFDSGVERSGDVFFCVTVPGVGIDWNAYLGSSSGRPFQMYQAFTNASTETSFAWSSTSLAIVGQEYVLAFSNPLTLSASHGAFMVMAANPSIATFTGSMTLHGSFVPAPSAIALLGLAGLAGRRRR